MNVLCDEVVGAYVPNDPSSVGPRVRPSTTAMAIESAQPSPQTASARAVVLKSSAWRTATTVAASVQMATTPNTAVRMPGSAPNTCRSPGLAAKLSVRSGGVEPCGADHAMDECPHVDYGSTRYATRTWSNISGIGRAFGTGGRERRAKEGEIAGTAEKSASKQAAMGAQSSRMIRFDGPTWTRERGAGLCATRASTSMSPPI